MTPVELGTKIISDTFASVLPAKYGSREARIQLLAVGLQESGFTARVQNGNGPAHGFWQNELGGMIKGVFTTTNLTIQSLVRIACTLNQVPCAPTDAYWAITLPAGDLLACSIARIGLLMDAQPLPLIGDINDGWQCYLRVWRPGAWARGSEQQRTDLFTRWQGHHHAAVQAFPS